MYGKDPTWLRVPKPVKPKETELEELIRLIGSEKPDLDRLARLLGQVPDEKR